MPGDVRLAAGRGSRGVVCVCVRAVCWWVVPWPPAELCAACDLYVLKLVVDETGPPAARAAAGFVAGGSARRGPPCLA